MPALPVGWDAKLILLPSPAAAREGISAKTTRLDQRYRVSGEAGSQRQSQGPSSHRGQGLTDLRLAVRSLRVAESDRQPAWPVRLCPFPK